MKKSDLKQEMDPRSPQTLARQYQKLGKGIVFISAFSLLVPAIQMTDPIMRAMPVFGVLLGGVAVNMLYIIAGIMAIRCGVDQKRVQACWVFSWVIIAASFVLNLSYFLLIKGTTIFILLAGIILLLANWFQVSQLKKALAAQAMEQNNSSYYDVDYDENSDTDFDED